MAAASPVTTRALVFAALAAVALAAAPPATPATVYYGGDILTMTAPMGGAPTYPEALVERGGRIVYVGTTAQAIKEAGSGAIMKDLKGAALAPGFVDVHGHLLLTAHNELNAKLHDLKSMDEVLKVMKEHAKTVPAGAWIEGQGYRVPYVGRHPTKEELDTISATQPVFVIDSSGHHASVNSAMLKLLGYTKDTKNPEGGVIYRKAGTTEPDGHLAEKAAMAVYAKRPPLPYERAKKGMDLAMNVWLSAGYTTANELGLGLSGDDIDLAKSVVDHKLLGDKLDLVAFAKASVVDAVLKAAGEVAAKRALAPAAPGAPPRYINRVRLHGVKFWMDGSMPTALLSQPFTNPPEGEPKGYKGVQVDSTAELEAAVDKWWKNGTGVVAAHVLGDGAVELFIRAMEKAYAKQGPTTKKHQVQHAGLVRPDQVKRIAKLGAVPSFTAGSILGVGDYLTHLYGAERDLWVMPAASFTKAGVNWTINTDHPSGAGQNLLLSLQDISNRATAKGRVLGPLEKVPRYDALRAMTINNAQLIGEDRTKGSLEAGKLADLVILGRNPIKGDASTVKDIPVLETIKEGRVVYKRPAGAPAPPGGFTPGNEAQEADEAVHPAPPAGAPLPRVTPAQVATVTSLLGA